MKEGRLTGKLTRQNRPLDSYLAGLGFEREIINEAVRFGNQIEADVQRHMVGKTPATERRISKSDAHRMFAMAGYWVGRRQEGGGE